ncbi:flagellar hook protein FlgE [Dethiobacter alkaliphilus]|uniref:flagellar hook protein FlgE n=1 Tax=Dethiobacter alkaliphilus TaxID=427926 RepID=UPI002226C06B|nr:flagellar hook protein FlgE [Dethiobacter alkaliphilus]MCW3488740.1 flagellar hook protein FlgE [Dethiobacter alkaliphilus]
MQRSLFTGVSGLRNHQTKLDVIGNNIANVNTTAFKAGRVRFQDILSQNIRGASAPLMGRGGINPAQVGLGMSVAAIDTIHNPGSLQNTGRPTDLAIQGDGFFVMSDGVSEFYSRDGAFSLGADGDLVNGANGFKPLGWQADAFGNIDTNAPLQSLNIPLGHAVSTRATENMVLSSNLNALAEAGDEHIAEVMIFDSQGGMHLVEMTFTNFGGNTWSWEANRIAEDGTPLELGGTGEVVFDGHGSFQSTTGDTSLVFTGIDDVNGLEIALDFNDMTQVVGTSNAQVRYQDGFPAGELDEFAIGKTGVISGIYTNGLVVELGQIALASFANPEGLTKAAGNMYQVSSNSGQPRVGGAGLEGRGSIETATLEMSNVDLSYEFTEMITTSRGFQANSRVITTSDDMLQEVVNLKR